MRRLGAEPVLPLAVIACAAGVAALLASTALGGEVTPALFGLAAAASAALGGLVARRSGAATRAPHAPGGSPGDDGGLEDPDAGDGEERSRRLAAVVARRTEELEALLAHAPVGFAFFDREGRYLRINKRLAEIDGLPAPVHLGRPIREVLPVNARVVEPVLERVFATGEAVADLEVEGETPARPGERRHWLTGFYPVHGAGGEVAAVGAVVLEITERKRAEEALREADRRKDEFLAMLAHELRNPLAPILTAVEVMRLRELGDPLLERQRDTIDRQVMHMKRLLDDLLDVSRVSRGKIALRREHVRLAAVVEQAVEATAPLMAARGHRLVVDMPREPVHLWADPARVTQVFTNLLNNAAKYTDPGGDIALTSALEGGFVVVRIADNGIGMTSETLTAAFELFAQGNRALDRAQGGLGVGLTLARRLVEMHGGELNAASAGLGRGSELTVRLPVVVAAENGSLAGQVLDETLALSGRDGERGTA